MYKSWFWNCSWWHHLLGKPHTIFMSDLANHNSKPDLIPYLFPDLFVRQPGVQGLIGHCQCASKLCLLGRWTGVGDRFILLKWTFSGILWALPQFCPTVILKSVHSKKKIMDHLGPNQVEPKGITLAQRVPWAEPSCIYAFEERDYDCTIINVNYLVEVGRAYWNECSV